MSRRRIVEILALGVFAAAGAGLWLFGEDAVPPGVPTGRDQARSETEVRLASAPASLPITTNDDRTASKPPLMPNLDLALVEAQIRDLSELPYPVFPDTEVGRQLGAHQEVVEGMGPDAEDQYQASLKALRENAEEAAAVLDQAYDTMPEERYFSRWKLVDTLSVLETEAAIEPLARIAAEPIGEERFRNAPHHSSQSEEAMIRAAAVDGLRRLAEQGAVKAESELLDLATIGAPDTRLAAVTAYRLIGDDQVGRTEALKENIAPDDTWMLELEIVGAPPATAYDVPNTFDEFSLEEEEDSDLNNDFAIQNHRENPPPIAEPMD